MSSLHAGKNGRQLLDLVDKLRNIDGIEKKIPLPQIVVVGQQSSGKSSVLHAISGISFPTDDGVCTQFPTELVLKREDTISHQARLRHRSVISDARKEKIRAFEAKWSRFDLKDVDKIIVDAKEVLEIDGQRRFTSESLILEVCGPEQEHLTLIDLPGYFVATQVGQDQSDIKLVNDIAEAYTGKELAIVLAIVSGKNDFENQSILEILKKDRGLRSRTLGVITAPDAIEPGSRRERDCLELLRTDPRDLGYRWHVLRNLKHSEIKAEAGTLVRDQIEQRFFEETEPWNTVNTTCLGNAALKTKLSTMLGASIAQVLPDIQRRIERELSKIDNRLADLGEERITPSDSRSFLYRRAQSFEQEVSSMLNGPTLNPVADLLDDKLTLRAFMENCYMDFANEMHDKARLWSMGSRADVSDVDTLGLIYSECVGTTTRVCPESMGRFLASKISRNRGKELPNMLDPKWAATYFRKQSSRWDSLARKHVSTIMIEVEQQITEAVERVADDEIAERLLTCIVQPALRGRKAKLQAKLTELYRPYKLPGIHCFSRKYYDEMTRICASPEDKTQEMMTSAEAYYEICIEAYIQNVVDLAVENCLLDGLPNMITQHIHGLTDDDFERLGGESEKIKEERRILSNEKARFEQARDTVIPSLRGRRLRPVAKANDLDADTSGMLPLRPVHDDVSPNSQTSTVAVNLTTATPPRTPSKATVTAFDDTRIVSPSPVSARSNNTERASPSSVGVFSNPSHSGQGSSVSSVEGSPAQGVTPSAFKKSAPIVFAPAKLKFQGQI